MFKKAFVAALMTATAFTPAFADGEDDTTETEIASEVTLSHVNGEALQIVCNYEVCKVHSLQPGADVWDREEVQPADVGVFETLVVKYAALGYT
jgi:hypothetical protein